MAAERQPAKIKVFISYSRRNIDFIDRLQSALKTRGIDASVDRTDIAKGEAWWKRIQQLITDADTIVFVLSPASAGSDVCQQEVDFAETLKKRIVPIVAEDVTGLNVPDALARLNYVFFIPNALAGATGNFDDALDDLVRTLETDVPWIREHTRIGSIAQRWQALGAGKGRDLLLRGAELNEAERWMASRPAKAPDLSDAHIAFLAESRRAATRRQRWWSIGSMSAAALAITLASVAYLQSIEAKQRRADAEQARVEAERQKSTADEQRYAAEQQRKLADQQRQEAERQQVIADTERREAQHQRLAADQQRSVAEQRRAEAVRMRNDALLSQSKYLADLSAQILQVENDPATAMLVALEALPDETSDEEITSTRPYYGAAEVSLESARRLLRELATLKGHTNYVTSVAVSRDGSRIVTGSRDKTAKLWDSQTFEELGALEGHTAWITSVAISSDGTRIVTGSEDNTAKVWDARTFAELAILKGHKYDVTSVAISPNGAHIVTGSADNSAKVWDARTFAELATLEGHSGNVTSVAISADSARIVTGSSDRTAKVWSLRTFRELGTLKGHISEVTSVVISPDGGAIVTGSHDLTAKVWNSRTFLEVGTLNGHTFWVTSVRLSVDGTKIVTVSEKTTRVWDSRTFRLLATHKGHVGTVSSVAVSGIHIVTASEDNTAKVWDARTTGELTRLGGQVRSHFGTVHSVAVTQDGTRIVTADNISAQVWDGRTLANLGRIELLNLGSIEGHSNSKSVNTAAISPDGSLIVTGSDDNTAKVWESRTLSGLATLKGHDSGVTSVAISQDGARIVTGSKDKSAKVWDAGSFAEVATLQGHTDEVTSVTMSPDGTRIITGSDDSTAKVWDAETFTLLATLKGHSSQVLSVSVSPDGTRIVTGSIDRTAKIWDARTFVELGSLKGHAHAVKSLAITADSSRIVSREALGDVKVWDATTFAQLVTIKADASSMALLSNGAQIITGSTTGAKLWEIFVSGQALIAEAKRLAPRCLTSEQRQSYHLTNATPRWCIEMQKWPYDAVTVGNSAFEDAWRLALRGRGREAIRLLERTMADMPATTSRLTPPLAWNSHSVALDTFRDVWLHKKPADSLRDVLTDINKAVLIVPDYAVYLDTRGHILLALGRAEEALTDFNKTIALGGNGIGTWYGRGLAHARKGNREAAIADFQKGLALPPRDTPWAIHVRTQANAMLSTLGVSPDAR